MTLLAAMVGAIALMSDGLGRMMRGGGPCGRRWLARGRQEGQPARAHRAGAVGLHPAHRARRVPPAGHGGEPEARVPRRRDRRRSSPGIPMALASRPGETRERAGADAHHHPGRGASLHRGSGGAEGVEPGRDFSGMSLRRIRRCGNAWRGSAAWPTSESRLVVEKREGRPPLHHRSRAPCTVGVHDGADQVAHALDRRLRGHLSW